MRVLLIVGDMHPRAGGPPQVVAGSAVALADRGHRVTIATLCRSEDDALLVADAYAALSMRGISVLSYPPDRFGLPGGSRAMARALAGAIEQWDVLHVHGAWEACSAQAAEIFRKAGKPVFVSAHGMLDRWSMAQSRAKKQVALRATTIGRMLNRADAIVFGTDDERIEGAQVTMAPGIIIANGVDSERLTSASLPEATALKARFPQLAAWTHTVLYFSRIHPKKGLDLLVEAMITLAPRYRGAGLLITGIAQDISFQAQIEARIAASGQSDHFALTTSLAGPSAKAAFRLADAFALPSHQEGFSMAIVEAMALECPVLITDACHLPEVQTAGAGFVVSADQAGVTGGLEAVLAASKDDLRAMGRRGRDLVCARYDWSQVAVKLEAAYLGRGQTA